MTCNVDLTYLGRLTNSVVWLIHQFPSKRSGRSAFRKVAMSVGGTRYLPSIQTQVSRRTTSRITTTRRRTTRLRKQEREADSRIPDWRNLPPSRHQILTLILRPQILRQAIYQFSDCQRVRKSFKERSACLDFFVWVILSSSWWSYSIES